jgi:hypothetical protein
MSGPTRAVYVGGIDDSTWNMSEVVRWRAHGPGLWGRREYAAATMSRRPSRGGRRPSGPDLRMQVEALP